MKTSTLLSIAALALATACAAEAAHPSAEFSGSAADLDATDAEATAMLRVANESSFDTLDLDVGLDRRAARNIVDTRGTGFTTLEALDAVPWVGPVALSLLLDYAYAEDMVEEDPAAVYGIAEGSPEAHGVLTVANTLDQTTLDDAVRLDSRAAANIVALRGTGFPSLAALDEVPYVAERAFGKLLAYATDNGYVVDPSVVEFEGAEQCNSSGEYYGFFVISDPPAATSDGRITLTFRSGSPYGPRPFDIAIETAPDEWTVVATTVGAVSESQTQTFPISADTLNEAMGALGWVRFRVNPGTAYLACSQLSLTYNCPSCLACPEGEVDRGFGCEAADAGYDRTILDHSTGACSYRGGDLTFSGAPEAGSDGTLSFDYVVCDGGSASVRMYTDNAGWVSIGSDATGLSCGFTTATMTIPEAYLDHARNEAGEIQIRYSLSDRCVAGVGCSGYNDPCIRRMRLQYGPQL